MADADVEVSKLSKDNKGKKCLHNSRERYMSFFTSHLKRDINFEMDFHRVAGPGW